MRDPVDLCDLYLESKRGAHELFSCSVLMDHFVDELFWYSVRLLGSTAADLLALDSWLSLLSVILPNQSPWTTSSYCLQSGKQKSVRRAKSVLLGRVDFPPLEKTEEISLLTKPQQTRIVVVVTVSTATRTIWIVTATISVVTLSVELLSRQQICNGKNSLK